MMNFPPRVRALAAIVCALMAAGCRDTGNVVQSTGQVTPKSITPSTTFALTGADLVLTIVLDVRGDVGKIGSFTGRLRFDPAGLTYAGELGIDDGTLRVSNPGQGEIRVAGASPQGINTAALASFRFVAKDTAAIRRVTFDIEELHELSRADLRSLVRGTSTGLSK